MLDTLERLIDLGFSPYLALIVAFVAILGGVIAAGFAFFWKQLAAERRRQDTIRTEVDKERMEWRRDVEERLEHSEQQHDDCQRDRDGLRNELQAVKNEVTRLSVCPRRDCPVRLAEIDAPDTSRNLTHR